jgi:tetratricopeptide (TPR) repeat protein
MVTGERMFAGTDLKVLDRVRKADFQPAETIVPDLPAEVVEILRKALAKAPSRRYKSCAAMQADLEECLSSFEVRPSAEGFSLYMKDLFREEIAAEFAALQRAEVQVSASKEAAVPDGTTKTLQILQHIEPVPATKPEVGQSTHRLWLGTWAVAMVAIAIILALFFKDKSILKPGKDKTKPSMQTTDIQKASPPPPTKIVKKPVTPPKPGKFEQAMEALRKERFAKAAALFEKALASDPGARARIAGPYAQALVGGAASILDSNPRQAVTLLRKAARLDPQNSEAYYYLGKLYTSKKDYSKAIKAYEKAIDLDPLSPDAFFNLGFIYYSTKEYSKAEKIFRKVVELRPFYLDEAYFNLAVVQNLQGKRKESIGNLERTLEVNPNNDRARKYLLRLKRTSQSGNENKQLENKGLGIAWTGTPDVLSRLRYSGQVCGADTREASLLG